MEPDWSKEPASDDLLREGLAPEPAGSKAETGLGMLRDMIAAAIALAIMFGLRISEEQVAGIMLFLATAGAFGTWAYRAYRSRP